MKKTLCLCLFLIINHSAYANDMTDAFKKGLYTALKTQTLQDYKDRCTQVLTNKGYTSSEVSKRCSCEVEVLNNNLKDEQYLAMVQRAFSQKSIFTKKELDSLKTELKITY